MATIGSLAVNITAVTDKFSKGIQSAKGMLSDFVGSIGVAQTAVAGLAVAGFGAIVNSAIEAGGKIQELTAKLHISSEALTALHFAANQLESSAEAVDAAIFKMSLTLGKAAQGNDEAINSFNRLNLNFQQLTQLPVEQQFLAIIDAIRAIPDHAQQAAAAVAIFGKGAGAIQPLIAAGSQAIGEMGQKAVEVGAVIGTDTVESLDNAGDSIAAFQAGWEGLKVQLVGTFAPAISGAMWLITKALQGVRLFWYDLQYAVVTGAKLVSEAILEVLKLLNLVLPKFVEFDIQQNSSVIDTLGQQQATLQGKMDSITGADTSNPLTKGATDVSGTAQTGKDAKAAMKNAAADKKQEEKETAANTKAANAQLKEIADLMRQGYSQNDAALKVVGVR